jgi:hypothetical protein
VGIGGDEPYSAQAALHQASQKAVQKARSSDGPTSMPRT